MNFKGDLVAFDETPTIDYLDKTRHKTIWDPQTVAKARLAVRL